MSTFVTARDRLEAEACWIFLTGDAEPWDVLEGGVGEYRTLKRGVRESYKYVSTHGSLQTLASLDHWMGRDLEPRRAYIVTPVTA